MGEEKNFDGICNEIKLLGYEKYVNETYNLKFKLIVDESNTIFLLIL